MNLKTGHLLAGGRYRVERVLGQGGFGITYEARDTKFKSRVKSVAIKEFFVKDFCNREQETNRIIVATQSKVELVEKLRNKFIDEANALFELEHPGIVRVTDTFEENGTAYYVMEYINGSSLSTIIETEGPLNENKALGYIRQAAAALEYLHGQNRLHLDIKPQNIMVDNDGRVVLIDFGVSKQYDEVNGENTSTLLGSTPGYAPIEQSGSGVAEFYPSTDIYSLGATLYKLLTGTTPLPAHQLASGETLPPLPNRISAATRKAVESAMSLNRNNRPQSIGEFLSLLEGKSKDERAKSKDDDDGATVIANSSTLGGEESRSDGGENVEKSKDDDGGATEILHSVQDDKYRENSSSTPGGEVSRSDGGEEHGNVTASDASQSGKSKDENGEQKILHSAQNDKKRPDGNTPKRPFNKRLFIIISVAAICIIAVIFGIRSCRTHGRHKGHEWVDLGLPSGVKWATCNVGASAPEDYGGYYAKGETNEKDDYSWGTYKWRNDGSKYGANRDDNKIVLDPEDDVAHVKWGGKWRMPTDDEFKELIDNCTWEWTTLNRDTANVYGYEVTGPNGNSIFLPAAGWCEETSFSLFSGHFGRYLSSSLMYGGCYGTNYLYFSAENCFLNNNNEGTFYGLSVRPVCE